MHHTCHHCCLGHHPINQEILEFNTLSNETYLRKRLCLENYLTPYYLQ